MHITTTIARHYALRCILISIGSLVLGLWGVYDYVYSIPARERHAERGEVCRLVMSALEPGRWREHADDARRMVQDQLDAIHTEHFSAIEQRFEALDRVSEEELQAIEAEVQAAIEAIREQDAEQWFAALLLFNQALAAGEPRGERLTGVHLLAYEVADRGAQQVANVKPPRAYDRPIQWAFIACLPFFPIYLWFYIDAKRRTYRLDEDGTLHLPESTPWKPEEIADIDMSRWMAKSIAYVVHTGGARVKLDDFKHHNMHRIVGAIASRLYPEEWDSEAKLLKRESPAPESA